MGNIFGRSIFAYDPDKQISDSPDMIPLYNKFGYYSRKVSSRVEIYCELRKFRIEIV